MRRLTAASALAALLLLAGACESAQQEVNEAVDTVQTEANEAGDTLATEAAEEATEE